MFKALDIQCKLQKLLQRLAHDAIFLEIRSSQEKLQFSGRACEGTEKLDQGFFTKRKKNGSVVVSTMDTVKVKLDFSPCFMPLFFRAYLSSFVSSHCCRMWAREEKNGAFFLQLIFT